MKLKNCIFISIGIVTLLVLSWFFDHRIDSKINTATQSGKLIGYQGNQITNSVGGSGSFTSVTTTNFFGSGPAIFNPGPVMIGTSTARSVLTVQATSTNGVAFTVYDRAGNSVVSVASSSVQVLDSESYAVSTLAGLANTLTLGNSTKPGALVIAGDGAILFSNSAGQTVGQINSNGFAITSGVVSSTFNAQYIKLGSSPSQLNGVFAVNASGQVSTSGTYAGGGGSAGKATCWKADGRTIGYCSSVVDVAGACTCN